MRDAKVVVFLHLVWGTWDRLPLLAGEIESAVYRSFEAKCVELRVALVAVGGVEDHVHLLVQLPATLAIADLVKHLKGASSHLITQRVRPGEFFKWQGAYAAFSIGPDDTAPVRDYILRQKEHHAANRLIPRWELPADESSANA
jgi:REP-associated tyrosine transposase